MQLVTEKYGTDEHNQGERTKIKTQTCGAQCDANQGGENHISYRIQNMCDGSRQFSTSECSQIWDLKSQPYHY